MVNCGKYFLIFTPKKSEFLLKATGTYECKVDAKGRLMFPSVYKSQMGEDVNKGFVIKRSIFKKCLELYPWEQWQKELNLVSKLNMFKKKNADFITKFMAGVKPIELDRTGRMLIPRDLIKFGGINKEIVLTSVVKTIEIWDKSMYEKHVEYEPEDFAGLAEDVLGDFEIQ